MKPIILVTGANGQVGRELRESAKDYPAYNFIFLIKEDLPIHDREKVEQYFYLHKPQYCLNCAAYTAVDKAESENDLAFQINGEATGVLAEVCQRLGTKFVHISTDYVFNGTASVPYLEDDAVDPVNAYGASKLLGEQLALKHNPDSIVIRTSWVYSEFGNNFVKTMMRLMKDRKSINVVADQSGSPTYAADLAKAMLEIVGSGKWVGGIFNYSNEGVITWHQFAEAIRDLTGSDCDVHPIPSSSYPTPARRPDYSVLDKSKIKTAYQLEIPHWHTSLAACVQKLQQ